jgi:phospholipase C
VVRPTKRYMSLLVASVLIAGTLALAPEGNAGARRAKFRADDITKVDHIVVLMQENRSYDHYFGLLHREGQPHSAPQSPRGLPNPLNARERVRPFVQTNMCDVADVAHSWNATHQQINGGRMDGFLATNQVAQDPVGRRAMGHYGPEQLPFYYSIANQFAIADRFFSSVAGPTYPNRFYMLAATSFGHIRNDLRGYTQKTIFRSLDEAQPPITWKVYLASIQVQLLFSDVTSHPERIGTVADYYEDARNGTLPQVAFVESHPLGNVDERTDEHAPYNVQRGQQFSHDIIKALTESPNWPSSALFLTYDEHGGYYDHVKPPPAVPPDDIPPMLQPGDVPGTFADRGPRVPTIAVSPYAKPHHVSHVVYDHTSILKFIETRFGLPPLTRRDAAADPMLDMFDFSSPRLLHPEIVDAPLDPAGLEQCRALYPHS